MSEGFVIATGEGHAIELPGWSMLVKVGAEATHGALTVVQGRMDPGHPGPPEHIHDGHDETFLLIEGVLRFRLGNTYQEVGPGGMVFAPRGQAHGFSNPHSELAVYVAMVTPSGYERYFERVADHFRRTGDLPDLATTEQWLAAEGTRLAPRDEELPAPTIIRR